MQDFSSFLVENDGMRGPFPQHAAFCRFPPAEKSDGVRKNASVSAIHPWKRRGILAELSSQGIVIFRKIHYCFTLEGRSPAEDFTSQVQI